MGFHCSAACGISPEQGLDLFPSLHWQENSCPLHHQGSPQCSFKSCFPAERLREIPPYAWPTLLQKLDSCFLNAPKLKDFLSLITFCLALPLRFGLERVSTEIIFWFI